MALPVFYKEMTVHLHVSSHVIVYPQGIVCNRDNLGEHLFPSHLGIQRLPQFKRMQHYRINLIHAYWWWHINWRGNSTKEYSVRALLKEQLRLLSDVLSGNEMIQTLTVTLPCLRCLAGYNSTTWAYAHLLDLLTPLRRIKVAKPVVLIKACNSGTRKAKAIPRDEWWRCVCARPECEQLFQRLQGAMGNLTGEKLTDDEQTWKKVKELAYGAPYVVGSFTLSKIEEVWISLYRLQLERGKDAEQDIKHQASFRKQVKNALRSMQDEYRMWAEKREKCHEESLRDLGAGETCSLKSAYET
ncbi:MAG: hypothetical protein Q9209_001183 [Squamulea sp. 1 TL-2023]